MLVLLNCSASLWFKTAWWWIAFAPVILAALLLADVLLANTAIVFVTGLHSGRRPLNPLRSVALTFAGYVSAAIAFSVFWVPFISASASDRMPSVSERMVESIYRGIRVLSPDGLDAGLSTTAKLLAGLEMLVGVYFLAILLAIYVSWATPRDAAEGTAGYTHEKPHVPIPPTPAHTEPGRTWFALIVVAGIVIGTGAGVLADSNRWATGTQVGLLAATLVAAYWYASVTQRLLNAQGDAVEISEHPWLQVPGWPTPTTIDDPGPLRVDNSIELLNVGRSPALIQRVTATQPQEPNASPWKVDLKGDSNPRVLAPGQGYPIQVATIHVGPGSSETNPVYLDVRIDYRTIHGGTGLVILRCRYSVAGGWKSRETRYQVVLSSKRQLPAASTP
jgi:hypothetical protein